MNSQRIRLLLLLWCVGVAGRKPTSTLNPPCPATFKCISIHM